MRFAVLREDVGHGQPLALLDQLVDVDGAASPGASPGARATVVLPAAMNPTR